MHTFAVTASTLERLAIADWFALTTADLERTACALLGEHPTGRWVRRGTQHAVIASVKLGSLAAKLDAELSALVTDAGKILSTGGEHAALRAAAFYHLRFENIHPLLEGSEKRGRDLILEKNCGAQPVPAAAGCG